MALTDIPQPQTTTAEAAAVDLRESMAAVLSHAKAALSSVRDLVRKQGRSAIAAELGDDAAAMLTVYNSLRDAVEAGKAVTVDELPE